MSSFKPTLKILTPLTNPRLLLKLSQLLHKFYTKTPLLLPSKPFHPHPFLYNSLMKLHANAGQILHALHLFDEMKRLKIPPDIACYTTAADALVASAFPHVALAVFAQVLVLGVAPDSHFFTVLVKLYSCRLSCFDLAYKLVFWMERCGCAPDVVTYSTLIAGLCRSGRVEEGWGVLDYMINGGCFPNVHTCTPIHQEYCCTDMLEEAESFLGVMEIIGCSPNTVTYNIFIDALCRIGNFSEVKKVLDESATKGWVPDEFTYSIYMDGLCKGSMIDEALVVFDIMIEKGLQLNAVTLKILLDCLCRGANVLEAKFLLERSSDFFYVVHFNTVMSRLCDVGQWRAVLKLFGDMLKKGIAANELTFSVVIDSLCKGLKHRKAKCIFNSNGVVPNVVTYTTLIHHLFIAGEEDEACRMFSRMRTENISPNIITYNIMIDCLCRKFKFREAIEYFHKSQEDGFSLELVPALVKRLVAGGKVGDLLNQIEEIMQSGLIIDVSTYNSVIKAFCRKGYCEKGEMYIVYHVLDKMLRPV